MRSATSAARAERQHRVLGGELLQAPLLPALGSTHLDARAAPLGQELLEGLGVPRVARDDDLRRDARRRAVVLEEERFEDRGHVLAGHVLEVEAVAVDELALAQGEDLDGGAVSVHGEPDDVDRPDGALVGSLPLCEPLDRTQAVAIASRFLEPLLGGGVLHPLLELAHDRLRGAGEELDDAVDHLPVVLLRDVGHAGARQRSMW